MGKLECRCPGSLDFFEHTSVVWEVDTDGERIEKVHESTYYTCATCGRKVVKKEVDE